jgi:hypothetical protein
MSHNKFDQFHALITQLAAADGTLAEERAPELLDTALAREVLEAIVGGRLCLIAGNPYASEDRVYSGAACLVNERASYSA